MPWKRYTSSHLKLFAIAFMTFIKPGWAILWHFLFIMKYLFWGNYRFTQLWRIVDYMYLLTVFSNDDSAKWGRSIATTMHSWYSPLALFRTSRFACIPEYMWKIVPFLGFLAAWDHPPLQLVYGAFSSPQIARVTFLFITPSSYSHPHKPLAMLTVLPFWPYFQNAQRKIYSRKHMITFHHEFRSFLC